MEDDTSDANKKRPEEMEDVARSSETVGFATNLQDSSISPAVGDANQEPVPTPETSQKATEPVDVSKDQDDDGGEMVVEGEDTVIY